MADKPKVVDEVWDDARVRQFLRVEPPNGVDRDFHRLLMAYRGMRPDDFGRFLAFFVADGGALDARDPSGRRLHEVIAPHRHGGPFLERLEAAARSAAGAA
jgi:hypothetical protein